MSALASSRARKQRVQHGIMRWVLYGRREGRHARAQGAHLSLRLSAPQVLAAAASFSPRLLRHTRTSRHHHASRLSPLTSRLSPPAHLSLWARARRRQALAHSSPTPPHPPHPIPHLTYCKAQPRRYHPHMAAEKHQTRSAKDDKETANSTADSTVQLAPGVRRRRPLPLPLPASLPSCCVPVEYGEHAVLERLAQPQPAATARSMLQQHAHTRPTTSKRPTRRSLEKTRGRKM
jgi:hypothetical protein